MVSDLETTTESSAAFFAWQFSTDREAIFHRTDEPSSLVNRLFVARHKQQRTRVETLSALICASFGEEHSAAFPPIPHTQISSRTHSLNQYIGSLLAQVSMVERVYSKYRSNVFYTWVVVEDRDQTSLEKIYEREKAIIERFPEFEFDFYVLYRKGQSVDTMISGDIDLVFIRGE